jgi:transposase
MESSYIIYGLIDPRNGELRYVGKSVCGIRRAKQHGYPYCMKMHAHLHSTRWIKQLRSLGLKYEIEVLEIHETANTLASAERHFIAYFRSIGCRLTNMTGGGDGTLGTQKSAETRHKMSVARGGAEAKRADAVRLYGEGLSTRAVAARLGIGYVTVFKMVKDAGIVRNRLEVIARPQSAETLNKRSKSQGGAHHRSSEIVSMYLSGMSGPDISRELGISTSAISKVVRAAGALRSRSDSIRGRSGPPGTPIMDQRDVVYKNAAEAGRILGLDASGIVKVLKGKQSLIGGYTFRYV